MVELYLVKVNQRNWFRNFLIKSETKVQLYGEFGMQKIIIGNRIERGPGYASFNQGNVIYTIRVPQKRIHITTKFRWIIMLVSPDSGNYGTK